MIRSVSVRAYPEITTMFERAAFGPTSFVLPPDKYSMLVKSVIRTVAWETQTEDKADSTGRDSPDGELWQNQCG